MSACFGYETYFEDSDSCGNKWYSISAGCRLETPGVGWKRDLGYDSVISY